MENEIKKELYKTVDSAIKEALSGYNSPLIKYAKQVVEKHEIEFVKILDGAISDMLKSGDFREALAGAMKDKLAKVLISKAGGEIEKRANELRANPETRAKITIALSGMINELGETNEAL